MRTSLNTPEVRSVLAETLDRLEPMGMWDRTWAEHQYVGFVLTAMCLSVVDDLADARQYAVLRLLETLLEDRFNLLPATERDFHDPRRRVMKLVIHENREACEPWIDILEYLQLRNWRRKGVYEDTARIEELRGQIAERFSPELLIEIDKEGDEWWYVR